VIARLGILAVPVDEKVQQVARLREPGGVPVAARTLDSTSASLATR
jgi:hypothetical protein